MTPVKDPRYLKFYVVGLNMSVLEHHKPCSMFLRQDGTWQYTMEAKWLPTGGTYFSTRNEAEIALAKTGSTDHTNQRKSGGRGACQQH